MSRSLRRFSSQTHLGNAEFIVQLGLRDEGINRLIGEGMHLLIATSLGYFSGDVLDVQERGLKPKPRVSCNNAFQ